jgi:hypothetical protein
MYSSQSSFGFPDRSSSTDAEAPKKSLFGQMPDVRTNYSSSLFDDLKLDIHTSAPLSSPQTQSTYTSVPFTLLMPESTETLVQATESLAITEKCSHTTRQNTFSQSDVKSKHVSFDSSLPQTLETREESDIARGAAKSDLASSTGYRGTLPGDKHTMCSTPFQKTQESSHYKVHTITSRLTENVF